MTLDELDATYRDANRLIAKRGASTFGKALLLGGESLDDLTREIADLYRLTDAEREGLAPRVAHDGLASIQRAVAGLFGGRAALGAAHALGVARTAIDNDRLAKAAGALVRAGPRGAEAVAKGGAVGRTTALGWLATAGYAAGSAAWLAYHAREFSLAAYKLVAAREQLELPPKPALSARVLENMAPAASAVAAGVRATVAQAEVALGQAADAGAHLASTTGDLVSRASHRLTRRGSDQG